MKPVNNENTASIGDVSVSVPMPGVPGGGLVPEARRPLRELAGERLLSGRGTRPGGGGWLGRR
jgi:hypothetical protein